METEDLSYLKYYLKLGSVFLVSLFGFALLKEPLYEAGNCIFSHGKTRILCYLSDLVAPFSPLSAALTTFIYERGLKVLSVFLASSAAFFVSGVALAKKNCGIHLSEPSLLEDILCNAGDFMALSSLILGIILAYAYHKSEFDLATIPAKLR